MSVSPKLKAYLRPVLIALALLLFLGLLQEVLEGELLKLDALAYRIFVLQLRSDWLTPIMIGFSDLASPLVILVICAVVAAFSPGRKYGRVIMVNLAVALALNLLLKNLIMRARPEGFRLVAESGYSFPSGHSMISMAFFGLLAWLVLKYEHDRHKSLGFAALFGVLIVCIGASRIYLGVHYASDVIAGFCVSFVWLAVFTRTLAPALMRDAKPAESKKLI